MQNKVFLPRVLLPVKKKSVSEKPVAQTPFIRESFTCPQSILNNETTDLIRLQGRALIKANLPSASRIQDVCPREPDIKGVRIGRSSIPRIIFLLVSATWETLGNGRASIISKNTENCCSKKFSSQIHFNVFPFEKLTFERRWKNELRPLHCMPHPDLQPDGMALQVRGCWHPLIN